MAAALSLTFGRGGALLGNLLFGFLIDLNCVIPIVLFAAMLLSEYYFRISFILKYGSVDRNHLCSNIIIGNEWS